MEKSFEPIEYNKLFEPLLIEFLEQYLPESGRILDINGRHSYYLNIENHFKRFWYMFDNYENIIGTVAITELDIANCELKSLYLFERTMVCGMENVC